MSSLRVLARSGCAHEPDPQTARRQLQLALGGLPVDAGQPAHQRAPVAVRDHAVHRRGCEGVALGDRPPAPLAVVDHGRRGLGPRLVHGRGLGGGVGRQVVLGPHHGHADVPQGLGHSPRPAHRRPGQPLGPVEVEHVDGGQGRGQPLGVVEQVVGHRPHVHPVGERAVLASAVPVVVGGRHHPQLAGHRPAEGDLRPGRELDLVHRGQLAVDRAPLGQPVDVDGRDAFDGLPFGADVERLARRVGDEDDEGARRTLGEGEPLVHGQGATLDAVSGAAGAGQAVGDLAERRARVDEPVVGEVERVGVVGDRGGPPAGREPRLAAPGQRDEAGQWLVGGHVEHAGPAGRGGVVGARPAHDRQGERDAGVAVGPHPDALAEGEPLVAPLWRRGGDGGRLGAGPPQVEGGRHQLPDAVERHLQAPERPAVPERRPALVGHHQPAVEPSAGSVGGRAGDAPPAVGVDRSGGAAGRDMRSGGFAGALTVARQVAPRGL